MKPRMRDVASRAGVSLTTASVVLRGEPGVRISTTTRERVLGAARDLGYAPRPGRVRTRLVALSASWSAPLETAMIPHLVQASEARDAAVVPLSSRSERLWRGAVPFEGSIAIWTAHSDAARRPAPGAIVLDLSASWAPGAGWGEDEAAVMPDDAAAAATVGQALVARRVPEPILHADPGQERLVAAWRRGLAEAGCRPVLASAPGGLSGREPAGAGARTRAVTITLSDRADLAGLSCDPGSVLITRGGGRDVAAAAQDRVPVVPLALPLGALAEAAVDRALAGSGAQKALVPYATPAELVALTSALGTS